MKYDETTFGRRCDALTSNGSRCRNTNQVVIQTSTPIRSQISTHDVCLCRRHSATWDKMHASNAGKTGKEMARLPLRDGGFFGGYNRHDYGGMVTADPVVDWNDPGLIVDIPKAWIKP